jgi:hypothetical protein
MKQLNPCCEKFPCPTTRFDEIGISVARHGTLFQCRKCGNLIEMIAEERVASILNQVDAEKYYPEIVDKK